MSARLQVLDGEAARPRLSDVARLRMTVFREYPYLYDGDLAYETDYLARYFASPTARLFVVLDRGNPIGVSTANLLRDDAEEFRAPLVAAGYAADKTVYFGESILLPDYRGQGWGKRFFEHRLRYARSVDGATHAAFCAVIRACDHPLRPADYRPLDGLWRRYGFVPMPGVTCTYRWKDLGEAEETDKRLQFWSALL